jgi:hypothetical protein
MSSTANARCQWFDCPDAAADVLAGAYVRLGELLGE